MAQKNNSNDNTWRTNGGSNRRDGLYPNPTQLNPVPTRKLLARGSVQTSVVFDRFGNSYVADMAGGVQAFDAAGKKIWEKRLDGGISATPVVSPDDERLYAGTHKGVIYAFNAGNGDIEWEKEIPSKSDCRILSDLLFLPQSNTVVLNSWGGKFYAINADSGELLFSWDAGISPYSSAVSDADERIYCLRAIWDRGVQFVSISPSGKESVLYTQPLQKKPANRIPVAASPIIDSVRGRILFITNLDRESIIHVWSLEDNKISWSYRLSCNVNATPSITKDGSVVVSGLDGFVYSISSGGELNYRYSSGCEYLLSGSVCDGDGRCYFGDPLGCVHRVEQTGVGRLLFESERAILARPSFDSQGNLYVSTADRTVYVFENRNV